MGAVCNVGLCDDEPELQVESEEELPPDPPMPGRWISSRGNQHVIGVDVVQWASGEVTQLRKLQQKKFKGKKKRTEWAIDMNGERFTVKFDNEGRLLWSDGDVWTRDLRAPETGTYAAVSVALVRATESFHDALSATPGALSSVVSATPGALSSAASYVASPLASFGGGGSGGASTAASPVGTGQDVSSVHKSVKFAGDESPQSQAPGSPMSPIVSMDERRANMVQATSGGAMPTMQAPLQGRVQSGQLAPTQLLVGVPSPYGAPQPQYMQQQSAPTQYQLPQQMPSPQGQMQAGPPVYPEALSPAGPRPKRRVAPGPPSPS